MKKDKITNITVQLNPIMNRWCILCFLILSVASCNIFSTTGSKKKSEFQIVDIEPFETARKAQITTWAYLTVDTITTEKVDDVLNEIYFFMRSLKMFKTLSGPKALTAYLYDSQNNAYFNRSEWIAMLSKTPTDSTPKISYNTWKMNATTGLNDDVESEDEKTLKELQSFLSNKGIDLCSLRKILLDIEDRSVKEADQKYPDFGIDHTEYTDQYYKTERKKIFTRYQIPDSLSTKISVFAAFYCK